MDSLQHCRLADPTLHIGNNPASNGTYVAVAGVHPNAMGHAVSARAVAEEASGAPLTPEAANVYWLRRAADFWLTDPLGALANTARKMQLFWSAYEVPNSENYYYVRDRSPYLQLAFAQWWWVAPLGLFGLIVGLSRNRSAAQLLLLCLSGVVVSVLVVFVSSRYRLPAVPLLIVGAGIACDWLVRQVQMRHWRDLSHVAAGLVVLSAFVWMPTGLDHVAYMRWASATYEGATGSSP